MTRVNYIERQRLRAEDLRGEQDYLLGLAGRHYVAPHTWGIVRGLVVTVKDQQATVSPGLAIDGYGRELIVFSAVELALPEVFISEWFVYLSYCERPKGGCGGRANSRWRDTAELSLSDQGWSIPNDPTELSIAQAAGNITDYPPWPVLLGVIARTDSEEYSRFTALRSARVLAPSGRALMRIGQETLADPYHFLVSVADKEGVTSKRFAIDRDGNKHLWGNLVLQGTGYAAILIAKQQNLILSVESPKALGRQIMWKVVPAVNDAGKETLEILFRHKESSALLAKTVLQPANARSINAAIFNHNNRGGLVPTMAAVRLSDIAPGEPAPDAEPVNTCLLDNREQPLTRAGALLKFSSDHDATDSGVFCGCREDDDQEPKPPPGFVFNPGPSPPTVPDSRDIYGIKTGKVERPIEELRFSNGLFAKGDFTHRFSIGGSQTGKPFQPWLSVRGDGGVALPGGKRDNNGNAFEMICVLGTVEYPPVKPDPRDPLFSYLMTFAFINGILALSSSLVKIAIKAPAFIETAKPDWEYELSVQNVGLTEPLLPFRGIENITSDTGDAKNDEHFERRLPARVDKETTVPVKIQHLTADLPRGAEIQIEAMVTMTAGSAKVGDKKKSEKIPVYQSPTIADDIPVSMPAGGTADFVFTITNGSSRKLTLSPILVEGIGAPQSVSPVKSELPPNEATKTNKVTIPASSAVPPKIEIAITVKYLWEGQTDPTEIKFSKTVTVVPPVPVIG